VSQLSSKKVRGEMKLRWMKYLTRQVEALVKVAKVAETLNNIGNKTATEIDLAA